MVIRGQSDIEVFISDGGYICLRQRSEENGENVIEFAPAYGVKIAEAINALQDFAQTKFEKAVLLDD
jgi:hypothetical protein